MTLRPVPPKPTLGKLAMHDFAAAVAEGRMPPRDRFGNPIGRGHLVMYTPELPMVFECLDVIPVLDPRLPQHMVKVRLAVQFEITLPVNLPTGRLHIIGVKPPDNGTGVLAVDSTPEDEPPPPREDDPSEGA